VFNPDYIVAVVTAGGVGIGAGRWTKRLFAERGARREEDESLRHSITGWPADQFSPARPGLLQTMEQLSRQFADHCASDTENFKALNDRLDTK
jgi:hypothetical protein